ncbi:MAG: hypothetical protein NW201_09490 [Gemmatimonadales bacterium]|nr:hypothetical protein [Gemmatimonadales bacterium]
MSGGELAARVEMVAAPLPVVTWRLDDETEILSGAFRKARKRAGLTGTVELEDPDGALAVLDVANGVICGLDIVIWPPIIADGRLALPAAASDGRVVLARPGSRAGPANLEVEAVLRVRVRHELGIVHLRIGDAAEAEVVRVAEGLQIALDAEGAVAGFWLSGVAELPPADDTDDA